MAALVAETPVLAVDLFWSLKQRFEELGGFVTEGVFKTAAPADELASLVRAVTKPMQSSTGGKSDMYDSSIIIAVGRCGNVHVIASIIMQWLRQQQPIPSDLFEHATAVARMKPPHDDGMDCLLAILSPAQHTLLTEVCVFLGKLQPTHTKLSLPVLSRQVASSFIARVGSTDGQDKTNTDAVFVSRMLKKLSGADAPLLKPPVKVNQSPRQAGTPKRCDF